MSTKQVNANVSTKPEEKPPGELSNSEKIAAEVRSAPKLLEHFAAKYLIAPEKILDALRKTAFHQKPKKDGTPSPPVSNEQMIALLVVAQQYDLNPFLREIYAFPTDDGGIMPIVGVDGWLRIINSHPACNGFEFDYGPEVASVVEKMPDGSDKIVSFPRNEWIECVMYRKDREHPIRVREYFLECVRNTPRWKDMPRRFLRHRALIQCGRYAFGFVGIYTEDDVDVITQNQTAAATPPVDDFPNGRTHHKRLPATVGALPANGGLETLRETVVHLPKDVIGTGERVTADGEVIAESPAKPTAKELQATAAQQEVRRAELIDAIQDTLGAPSVSEQRLRECHALIMKNIELLGQETHARLLKRWHECNDRPMF